MTSFFLVGDSISIGYGPLLEERIRPFGSLGFKSGNVGPLNAATGRNAGDSGRCLEYLRACFAQEDFRPDWLLLNCGLHDVKRTPTGEQAFQVPPETYRENLRTIFRLARERGQKLCWITTTPAFESVHNQIEKGFYRFAADVEAYNAIAEDLCREWRVPMIDLHAFTLPFCPDAFCDHVHYKEPILELQAAYIAGHLERLARDPSAAVTRTHPGLPVPDALVRTLNEARRVVVVTHLKPDGDAFGSALGLAGYLRAAGRPALVVGLDPVPETYSFLRGLSGDRLPADQYQPVEGDLMAICDCGALDRIPEPLRGIAATLPTVCIDHHKTNAGFTPVAYIDPAASSTAELVWRIAQRAGWPMDEATAEALWVGLVTDTGRFAYDCTSPETLRCAADVLERGRVQTSDINDFVYGRVSEARLRLQQRAIASLQRSADGRVSIVSLTHEDYAACGATSAESENFVDIARSIRGVEVAAFLYSGEEGRVSRLSLRSAPPYDAGQFCQRFGGGGHARASGATLELPVPEARAQLLKQLEDWMGEHGSP